MGELGLILKIAGVGFITLLIAKMFESSKKDELAALTTIAGLVIVFMMVAGLLSKLFDSIKTIFQF